MTPVRALLVLLLVLGLVLSACGGGGEPSAEEYGEAVVLNRNRADFVLGRITRAPSPDELLTRMDEAAVVISKAADELEDTGAPSEYQPEADDLVTSLRPALRRHPGDGGSGARARIRGPVHGHGSPGPELRQLGQVNKALAGLAGKGIQVSILQPKGGQQ